MRRLALFLLVLMTCFSVDAQKSKTIRKPQTHQRTSPKARTAQTKQKKQAATKSLFIDPASTQLMQTLGGMVWAVLKTPMAVAGITAAICDSLIPGTDKERGINVRPEDK